ncbi:hypothetical protein Ae717Ps2_6601c [Pseudonocardia sp. Ae717_Ps2]|nr:hypothetical protein Ae717Ps2_6601c [Pseudonocardia sp. Ae717_Ps2]
MRTPRRMAYLFTAAAASALALVAAPATADSLASAASAAAPKGNCGGGVQTYRMTGPINAWGGPSDRSQPNRAAWS